MKKHLFYLAAAVVAMSSCTESEVIEISQSKAIGFDSYVGNTTRAEQEGQTLDVLKEEGNGFYVFGTYKEEGKDAVTTVFDGVSENSHIKVCQKHSLSILALYISDYVIVRWAFLMDFEDFSDVAEMKKI